jgi:hypothetical protein
VFILAEDFRGGEWSSAAGLSSADGMLLWDFLSLITATLFFGEKTDSSYFPLDAAELVSQSPCESLGTVHKLVSAIFMTGWLCD